MVKPFTYSTAQIKRYNPMKNKYLIALLALLLFSCSEDIVTLEPQATLFASEYFTNASELEESVIATYHWAALQMGQISSESWSFIPPVLMQEVLSDNGYAGGQDASDGQLYAQMGTFSVTTTNEKPLALWRKNYLGIGSANYTISRGELLLESDEAEEVQVLLAEAKFLRAYFHFDLVRYFENIPLMDFLPATVDEANVPQAEPEAVYNFIASDLVEAIEHLPEMTGSARASKWAAQALLARVYLFKNGVYGGDLQAGDVAVNSNYVLTELEELINSSGHDLFDNFDSLFYTANEFSIESVFEVAYEDGPVTGDWGGGIQYIQGNLAAHMMGPRVAGGTLRYRGWSFATLSHKLFLAMEDDPRLNATILTNAQILSEPGASFIESEDGKKQGYQLTGYYNNKYTTRSSDFLGEGANQLFNITNRREIRFADVLLMAAELSQDVSYINRVRARVGLEDLTGYSEEALFHERHMEFAGEGHRYYDLMRRGIDVMNEELNVSVIGPQYESYPLGDAVYEVSVTFDGATPRGRGFLPIPQTEIDLSNGTLIQNEGY